MNTTEELLTTQITDDTEFTEEETQPKKGVLVMSTWTYLILINLITFLITLHSMVYFVTPLNTIETQVKNNITSTETFTVQQSNSYRPSNHNWKEVMAMTIIDSVVEQTSQNSEVLNEEAYDRILSALLSKNDTFEDFIESIKTTPFTTQLDDKTELLFYFSNVKQHSFFPNFKKELLNTRVGIMKQGYFLAKRDKLYINQISNDGIFQPGPLRQITPFPDQPNSVYFDPAFYEVVGFDNNFITRLDVSPLVASTSGTEEREEGGEQNFFTKGGFFLRSPWGNETWENLNSLLMKESTPSISKYSMRSWLACKRSNLDKDECTHLRCKSGTNTTLYNELCSQNVMIVGTVNEGYPMIASDKLSWMYYKENDEKQYKMFDVIVDDILEPIEGTVLQHQQSKYGYGAVSYAVLSEMETEVSSLTGAGYATFNVKLELSTTK
ncbi:hypothetical protein EIN_059800 [Entamoeba invadens IP1]|uniref:hypothetical protein n=1 Tax=Entamoeba invadens IP1 TaxID=370355 RepID=UPI0002C3D468|nr:hypothetical protein EIN_059800 [Entamoeba invadens IP1]ELP93485.1 hypothetical protein EIN_059800 [Entamoeba invadens IP1]|eukprot:XP_004260256.1 hypothetical protein EIN_059800 [Entamoeba invadens IP1]